jgi:hypothetical protein
MRGFILSAVLLVGCGGQASQQGSGGTATGGSSANGGAAGTTDCGAPINFVLTAPASVPYCIGRPSSCDNTWLTIGRDNGLPITTFLGCGTTPCDSCQGIGCTLDCPISSPLPPAGVQSSWDGKIWLDGATCGSGLACSRSVCAPAGHYIAHMCGYELVSGDGGVFGCESGASATPTCVDVPFDVPPGATVKGVLPGQ